MDNEIEQLKREIERLQKALSDRQQVAVAPSSLIDNVALVEDLARYSEGSLTRDQVKRRWKKFITEEMWKTLGDDNELVDAIEARKIQRIRDGSLKKERAQTHIVRGPDALASIMDNPESNARHKVDAIKTLDALAGGNSETTPAADRFHIVIDLGQDYKLKFDKSIAPIANDKDVEIIDSTPQEAITDESDR